MTIDGRSITLLLIEDHRAIGQGLAALLADEPGITVRLATDASTAASELERDRPTVALCDVMLGGFDSGFDLLRMYGSRDGTAFIMFSAHDYPGFYARAVELGAAGYVAKTASVEEIMAAVRRAAGGERLPNAETLRRARTAMPAPTQRELEIIGLVVTGRPNREIATTLGVGVKTIESHLRRLFDRYGVDSRTELAALAWHQGWVPGDL